MVQYKKSQTEHYCSRAHKSSLGRIINEGVFYEFVRSDKKSHFACGLSQTGKLVSEIKEDLNHVENVSPPNLGLSLYNEFKKGNIMFVVKHDKGDNEYLKRDENTFYYKSGDNSTFEELNSSETLDSFVDNNEIYVVDNR